MTKQAISVTLDPGNLTWLRGRAAAAGLRSISELLNRIVSMARTEARITPARSVVGTVDVDPADRSLDTADSAVRAWFDASLDRSSLMVRETRPAYGRASKRPAGRARRRA
jgi:hypothetical protein